MRWDSGSRAELEWEPSKALFVPVVLCGSLGFVFSPELKTLKPFTGLVQIRESMSAGFSSLLLNVGLMQVGGCFIVRKYGKP